MSDKKWNTSGDWAYIEKKKEKIFEDDGDQKYTISSTMDAADSWMKKAPDELIKALAQLNKAVEENKNKPTETKKDDALHIGRLIMRKDKVIVLDERGEEHIVESIEDIKKLRTMKMLKEKAGVSGTQTSGQGQMMPGIIKPK